LKVQNQLMDWYPKIASTSWPRGVF